MKRISIITVSFNSEKTIRKTIEAVLNQTVSPYEYIIIDGKSTDTTVDIAKEYTQSFEDKNIKYTIVSEKDNGIYDAMNKGIDLATGDIIGLINSDDWYEPNALEVVAKTYEAQPFDMFFADIRLHKSNGNTIIKHSKLDRFPSSRHWNHPTTFITKATYNDLGKYSCTGLSDDFELYLKIRKSNKKIVVVNEVLANFVVGGVSNKKGFKECRKRIKDRYRCYKNNGYSKFYYIECVLMEFAKMIMR